MTRACPAQPARDKGVVQRSLVARQHVRRLKWLKTVLVIAVLIASGLGACGAADDESVGSLLPVQPSVKHGFDLNNHRALVIVSTVDGGIHALEAKTGVVRWTISSGGSIAQATKAEQAETPGNRNSPPQSDDQSNWDSRKDLLVRDSPSGMSLARESPQVIPSYERGGGLWLFHDGKLKRVPMTASQIVDASPFMGDDGFLYIGKKKTNVFAVDALNGKARWQHYAERDQEQCTSEDHHGTLILTRSEYTLHAKDASTGMQNWNMTIAEFEPQSAPDQDFFAGQELPVLVTGSGTKGSTLYNFDRLTGELAWEHDLPSPPVCAHMWAEQHSKELPIHNQIDFEQDEEGNEPESYAERSIASVFFGDHQGTLFARPSLRPKLDTDIAFFRAKMQLVGSGDGDRSSNQEPTDPMKTALVSSVQKKGSLVQSAEDGSLTSEELAECVQGSPHYPSCLLGYHKMNIAAIESEPPLAPATGDNFAEVPFEPPPPPLKRSTWFYVLVGFCAWPLCGIGMCWTAGGRRKILKIIEALRDGQSQSQPISELSPDGFEGQLVATTTVQADHNPVEEEVNQLALVPKENCNGKLPSVPSGQETEDGEASKRSTVDSQKPSKLLHGGGDSNLSLDTSHASFSWSYTDSDWDEETESRDAVREMQRNRKESGKNASKKAGKSSNTFSPSNNIKEICAELDDFGPRRRDRSGLDDSDLSGPGWALSRDSSWSTDEDSAIRGRSISLGSHISNSQSLQRDVDAALSATGYTLSAPSSPQLQDQPSSPWTRKDPRHSNDWQSESRYLKDFVELGSLGKGGFGSVYKVRQKLDEREYAVKKIKLENDPNSASNQRVIREVKNMAILSNHPNIVRYYGTWTETVAGDQQEPSTDITFSEGFTEGSVTFGEEPTNATTITNAPATWLYIQMELCSTSLRELLNDGTWKGDLDLVRGYIADVSEGLLHCHSQKYIHRDIKPDNIFIVHEVAKLGDFGLSCRTGPEDGVEESGDEGSIDQEADEDKAELTKGVGTHMYASPELDNNGMYDEKVDMYALGICLFEMLNKFSTRMERIMVIGKLKQAMARKYDELPSPFSSEASKAATEEASETGSEGPWSSDKDMLSELVRGFSQIVPDNLLPEEMLRLKRDHPVEAELVLTLMALEPAQRPTARKFRDRLRELVPRDKEQELLESKRYIQQLKIQLKQLEEAGKKVQPSDLQIPPPIQEQPRKPPARTLSEVSQGVPIRSSDSVSGHSRESSSRGHRMVKQSRKSPSKMRRSDTAPGDIENAVPEPENESE